MKEEKNVRDLLGRMALGDRKAYEELFRTHYASMVLYANRLMKDKAESEDLVADLFYDLWSKRQQLSAVKSDRNYLFVLLRNRIVDFLRREHRIRKEELADYASEDSVENAIFEVELYKQLYDAIETLPKKCAEVFRLKLQGLDDHEIAKILQIEYETVRSHSKRGISLLRGKMDNPYLLLLF